jgi:outer membrane receptor protein involved in Fe transport
MSNQDFGRDSPAGNRERDALGQRTAKAASDAFSTASALAGEAATKAKQAASDSAATVTEQVKQLLDHQVNSGADMVRHLAGAVNRAAQELDRDAPQLAGLVRTAAGRMDGYADGLRNQSVEQLMRAASDFTRRQPAMVFGLAALAGFFALRTLKSAPSSVASPPIQPAIPPGQYDRSSEFHGA